MSATELLCRIIGINHDLFTDDENTLLEAELFSQLCNELRELQKSLHKRYFRLLKFSIQTEYALLEGYFIQSIIQDILLTGYYSLQGIASYVGVPEEVLFDLAMGTNKSPTLQQSRRIIDLHRSVRPKLYRAIMEKVIAIYSETKMCEREKDK